MKGSDRAILLVLPLLALVVGFYLLVISPKRADIAEKNDRIDELNASIQASESQVGAAEAARDAYGDNYADVVSLGTAVPEDSDQASFVYSMNEIGADNSVQLRSWELVDAGGGIAPAEPVTPPVAPPATSEGDSSGSAGSGSEPAAPVGATDGSAASAAPVAATPTEASASLLPLGASVGPAGLPVLPYTIKYTGTFFKVADLLDAVNAGVEVDDSASDLASRPDVRGRLVTVDGFALTADPDGGFPDVQATLALTTYVVPEDQGLSAGATPAGPPTVASPQPASSTAAPPASTSATVTP